MRVLHLSVFDDQGGAARAALRLHRGLYRAGIESAMLVRDRGSDDPGVVTPPIHRRISALARAQLDHALERRYRQRIPGGLFTTAPLPEHISADVRRLAPDLVNLHWIGEGFVRPESLRRFGRPLVWTLHDAYPFTGGCHVAFGCERYIDRCGACPSLGSTSTLDMSRITWSRKRRAWRSLDLTAVAPSRWMAGCAARSSLLRDHRIEVIPNGVDTLVYRPIPRATAREILNLPQDRRLALFMAMGGAATPIKGFVHLAEALRCLAASGRSGGLELILAGASRLPDGQSGGVPVHCVGPVGDDVTIALLHAAADVVVVPSTQENLPNVVMEALACGRPAVAFGVGGISDLIENRQTGVLVEPFDVRGLAAALCWVIEDEVRWESLSRAARAKAEREFALDVQATRYLALYQEILDRVRRAGALRLTA